MWIRWILSKWMRGNRNEEDKKNKRIDIKEIDNNDIDKDNGDERFLVYG